MKVTTVIYNQQLQGAVTDILAVIEVVKENFFKQIIVKFNDC